MKNVIVVPEVLKNNFKKFWIPKELYLKEKSNFVDFL